MEDNKSKSSIGELKDEFLQPVEDLAGKGREFVDKRIDLVKLSTIEALSRGLGRFLAGLTIVSLVIIIGNVLALAGILFLGDLIGSYGLAALIVALVFIALLALVLIFRHKLFVDGFVRMFYSIFFDGNEED